MSELSITLSRLQENFKDNLKEISSPLGQDTVVVPRESIISVAKFLKENPELDYNFLTDLTAVDKGPEQAGRFTVVYHFFSLKNNSRVRIKVDVPEEDPAVDSLTSLYSIANWYERETWDMYGIKFNGHPDLRRLLMYKEFQGHPLRKDYPLNKQQPLVEQRRK